MAHPSVLVGGEATVDPVPGMPGLIETWETWETWETDEPSHRGVEGVERMQLTRDDIDARATLLLGQILD